MNHFVRKYSLTWMKQNFKHKYLFLVLVESIKFLYTFWLRIFIRVEIIIQKTFRIKKNMAFTVNWKITKMCTHDLITFIKICTYINNQQYLFKKQKINKRNKLRKDIANGEGWRKTTSSTPAVYFQQNNTTRPTELHRKTVCMNLT